MKFSVMEIPAFPRKLDERILHISNRNLNLKHLTVINFALAALKSFLEVCDANLYDLFTFE